MDERERQRPTIELRHLRYFLAVYEELHFGRAAGRLQMAQPPLSRAVRNLESALGVKLFDRTSRSVTATEAGHALAEGARRVFASVDLALATARSAGHEAVKLRVGCVPELPIQRLVRFLAGLQERAPESAAEVTHMRSLEQLEGLRDGDLDVAIFYEAGPYDDLEIVPVFAGEPLVVLIPTTHPLAERTVVRPTDLSDVSLVTGPRAVNPQFYDRVLELAAGCGYRFPEVHELTGVNPRDLVLGIASGSGVALIPASVAEAAESTGIVVHRPLDPPVVMPDTTLGWPVDPPRLLPTVETALRELAHDLRATA
jgi:DNA-binding transcriptional LysR family regulator